MRRGRFVNDYDFHAISYTFLTINMLPMALIAFEGSVQVRERGRRHRLSLHSRCHPAKD